MYKRILASLVVSVFAVAMAVAQSSSSSGSYPSSQSSSGQTSAQPSSPSSPDQPQASTPNTPSSTDQSATQQSTTSTTTSSTTTTAKADKEKTIRGCIVQQASDFYLQPVKGKKGLIKLNTSEDLKAHVGHEVKVTGMESKIAASASATTPSGASASATTSPSGTETASNQSGSNAGQMPQSDVNATANATRELQVSKVEMVSDTCSIKSSSDMNNSKGAGNTIPPPQK